MQIVIEIDEKIYNDIRSKNEHGKIFNAVKNGTPLPKCHGRLIDADELESRMKIGYCIVKNAPTIIEADEAESEEVDNDLG